MSFAVNAKTRFLNIEKAGKERWLNALKSVSPKILQANPVSAQVVVYSLPVIP
jgi:hypothetical protein